MKPNLHRSQEKEIPSLIDIGFNHFLGGIDFVSHTKCDYTIPRIPVSFLELSLLTESNLSSSVHVSSLWAGPLSWLLSAFCLLLFPATWCNFEANELVAVDVEDLVSISSGTSSFSALSHGPAALKLFLDGFRSLNTSAKQFF